MGTLQLLADSAQNAVGLRQKWGAVVVIPQTLLPCSSPGHRFCCNRCAIRSATAVHRSAAATGQTAAGADVQMSLGQQQPVILRSANSS